MFRLGIYARNLNEMERFVMKHSLKRGMSMMLALFLVVSLFSGLVVPAQAATIKNYGYRGDTAKLFSSYATKFYKSNDVTYEELAALSGSSTVSSVPSSELYIKLKALMTDNHTYINTYADTKEYFASTDCEGEGKVISSFYSGTSIGPEWDSGATWNREHTWPDSKGLDGSDENDIMMLRPTVSNENSARGNKAYGESSGYYNPNSVSGGLYNLHGDVARIALYVYVRWGNTGKMWGSEGVIESKDVLLKWMEEDPVDTWELGRNDVVMSITGTRNVFVDYPELAFVLFGEEVPADMITPSGSAGDAGETYSITATVNDASMGSVTLAGSIIKAVPATGYQIEGYEVTSGEATVYQNGDLFTVDAKSDCTVQINFSKIPVPTTLAEMLAAASKLDNETYLPYTTTIQGKVSSIDEEYNTTYKNITFYVDVDGTQVYCYRVKGDGMDTLAVGDTVKVEGNLTAHYNSPQFDKTATVTVIEKAPTVDPEQPGEPSEPESAGGMIDFSKADQRTSYSSTQQIWQNDGIKLTNNKAGSSSNVGNYTNPGRFYKGSQVTIEYPGMTKVVFYCSGGSKYNMAVSDIKHLGTATAAGSVITLVLDEPVDSITYTCASNQNRYSKIEVFAEAPQEEGCAHKDLQYVPATSANCTAGGNMEYWHCPECGLYWADEKLTQEITLEDTLLPPSHSDIIHVPAVEPTYEEEGNLEYWYCSICSQAWLDANRTQPTTLQDVILPKLDKPVEEGCKHENLVHVEEGCYNIEHWYCEECQVWWQDADLTQITNAKNVIKAEPTHELQHVEESCYNVEHWLCEVCQTWWADEALTQQTNAKNVIKAEPSHKIEHVEESCYNIEHWYCNLCEGFWTDEELTQVSNSKNVIKAEPSHELVHVEASCYNNEHWYCEICQVYWADEALTQITNRLNVIKAEPTHQLVHVEAVAPNCTEEGNIEHWYCGVCETVWSDEDLTQVTNHKSVILPIDKDAHKWGKWETTKEATCTAKGKETRVCDHNDDHVETRDIAKIKHVDKNKDEKCDVCKGDLTNSSTADTIMITGMVMVVAAALLMVLLMAAPTTKGKYLK